MTTIGISLRPGAREFEGQWHAVVRVYMNGDFCYLRGYGEGHDDRQEALALAARMAQSMAPYEEALWNKTMVFIGKRLEARGDSSGNV